MRVLIQFFGAIQWCPLWLLLEQAHGLDILSPLVSPVPFGGSRHTSIVAIGGKSVIDASRQDDKIILLHPNAHPIIFLASHVKEAITVKDVSYLFILMQVFIEEHFHLLLINITHLLRRNGYFITVLVATFHRKCIDLTKGRTVIVRDSEPRKIVRVGGTAGVMV